MTQRKRSESQLMAVAKLGGTPEDVLRDLVASTIKCLRDGRLTHQQVALYLVPLILETFSRNTAFLAELAASIVVGLRGGALKADEIERAFLPMWLEISNEESTRGKSQQSASVN